MFWQEFEGKTLDNLVEKHEKYTKTLFLTVYCTPELLSKKHLNFGQGLEFLKFGQGNRGPNQQNRGPNQQNRR